jgi:hypothetical protein
MICVCSIISVISASYYSEVNLHGFVKLFKISQYTVMYITFGTGWRFCGATEQGYKCDNVIDFVSDNLGS